MKKRMHIFVSGRVQGVFFRSSTKDMAQELGLTGWVRNLGDGRVEAVFEGEQGGVEKMIQWCRRGPEYARVDNIEVIPERYTGEFKGFAVRHSISD
ncbi:acylphosphatase [Candidatus Methanoperedens nitroreducens]|uniref:Acylphosphatase n=1 Tax=Candidatus Methanoperedens nitratireducens TaxID=1392998 RepID=A0A062V3U2_9EURY|nr:acylphosphatase [Candidatus Methanoperedens nitroreducens]KCZ70459.1 acylphosphatase [Candidatus Methanoperedens nitroreducens]MDJ1420897.1 acylphosphatase [Candidatus Methanoperedens sp.]